MGSGAPKRITGIPLDLTVNLFTAEALLDDTLKKLGNVIKLITNGSEDPAVWEAMQKLSDRMRLESRNYTGQLNALKRYSEKG